jgi:hypothetical protein
MPYTLVPKNPAKPNHLAAKAHEKQRRELYCAALVAYCGASNAVDKSRMKGWADEALENFDKTFPNPIQ